MIRKLKVNNQPKEKNSTPKWYQRLWVKIFGILSVVGVIATVIADGGQAIDRFMGTQQTDSVSNSVEQNVFNNSTTTFQGDTPKKVLPAKIDLAQFALNSDLCYYKTVKSKDYGMSLVTTMPSLAYIENEGKVLMTIGKKGTTYYPSYDLSGDDSLSIPKGTKFDTIKIYEEKKFPIFDITFSNDGDEQTILTVIKAHVYYFEMPQGDGVEGGGTSHAIEVVNRYKITLPELDEIFHYPDTGEKRKKDYVIDYPAIPTVVFAPHDPARIQIELSNSQTSGAYYGIAFEFVFSNGQSILSDKIRIEF